MRAPFFPGLRHLLPQRRRDTRVALGLVQGLAHGIRYPANHIGGLGDTTHAAAEIHQLMRKLAGEGMAILMISSELPEILGMSDRVLVMNSGRIVGEFDKEHATAEAVGTVMTRSYAREQAA